MSKPIITVENLSKKYIIGENIHGRGARTFRDIFDHKMKRLFSKEERQHKIEETTLWALKDVSFEVNEGDVVGIIGRNGAGKSTLLKILSRITEPTSGRITLRGRVASLLEVGTGFNQELTGRENIYLNGSILGMRKWEIDKKFDEIVAFAEIEKFLDTPVKRYSSGMYVRLAFAVAAHLDPEILVVDEVLAVGDNQFQKKCLGKMEEVSKGGRTVLFVSHNLNAIAKLCKKSIYLKSGKLEYYDRTELVIDHYFDDNEDLIYNKNGLFMVEAGKNNIFGNEKIVQSIELFCNRINTNEITPGDEFIIRVNFLNNFVTKYLGWTIIIKNKFNEFWVCIDDENFIDMTKLNVKRGHNTIEFVFNHFPIYEEGKYFIEIYLRNGKEEIVHIDEAAFFNVKVKDVYGTGIPPKAKQNKIFVKNLELKIIN